LRRAKDEGRIRLLPRFASRYLSTGRELVVYSAPTQKLGVAVCRFGESAARRITQDHVKLLIRVPECDIESLIGAAAHMVVSAAVI
jgi:hypothetical protein